MINERALDFDVSNDIVSYKYSKYKKTLSLLKELEAEKTELEKELKYLNVRLNYTDLQKEDWEYTLTKSEIDTLIHKIKKNNVKQEVCNIKLKTLNGYR